MYNTIVHLNSTWWFLDVLSLKRQQPLTAEAVIEACSSPRSSKTFRQAIKYIKWRNIRVDLRHAFNASYHFDAECFTVGKRIITHGLSAVKANNKQGNFEVSRQMLGEILHPLQVCLISLSSLCGVVQFPFHYY